MKTRAILLLLAASLSLSYGQGWRDKQGNPIPDNDWSKSKNGFGVQLLVVDEKKFFKAWNTPSKGVGVTFLHKMHRGSEAIFPVIFAGCAKDTNGKCVLTGSYEVLKPDHSSYGNIQEHVIFDHKPLPGYMLNLSPDYLKIIFEQKDKTGIYIVDANITDTVGHISLHLRQKIELVDDNVTIDKQPKPKNEQHNPPQERPLSEGDKALSDWFTYAYKYDPQNDESNITALLHNTLFFKKPSSFLPLASFMTERFKLNDTYITKDIPAFKKLQPDALMVLVYALKMADTTTTRSAYQELIKQVDDQRFLEFIRQKKPTDTKDMVIDTPGKIDIHWAAFLATGKRVYVEKIIDLLSLDDKGVKNILLTGSAKWSLLSNCEQHPKVLQICKEYKSKNKKVQKALSRLLQKLK